MRWVSTIAFLRCCAYSTCSRKPLSSSFFPRRASLCVPSAEHSRCNNDSGDSEFACVLPLLIIFVCSLCRAVLLQRWQWRFEASSFLSCCSNLFIDVEELLEINIANFIVKDVDFVGQYPSPLTDESWKDIHKRVVQGTERLLKWKADGHITSIGFFDWLYEYCPGENWSDALRTASVLTQRVCGYLKEIPECTYRVPRRLAKHVVQSRQDRLEACGGFTSNLSGVISFSRC